MNSDLLLNEEEQQINQQSLVFEKPKAEGFDIPAQPREALVFERTPQEQQLQNNYLQALSTGKSPEQFAEIFRTAQAYNLPAEQVAVNPTLARQAAEAPEAEDWAEFAKKYPQTAQWLRAADNMATAVDVVGELAEQEGFFKQIGSGWRSGMLQLKYGQLGMELMSNRNNPEKEGEGYGYSWLTGFYKRYNEQETLKKLEEVELKLAEINEPKGFAPGYHVANQLPIMGKIGLAGLAGSGAGATVGGAKGAKIGAALGSGMVAFEMEAGAAYREFTGLKDVDGNPLNPNVATVAAVAVGAINAGLEMVSWKKLLDVLPGGKQVLKFMGKRELTELVKQGTTGRALTNAVADLLKAATTETLTEYVQETVTGSSGLAARAASGQKFDDGANFARVLDESAGVISPTMQATLFNPLTLWGTGSNFRQRLQMINQAQMERQAYKDLGENAENSQYRQRMPEAWQKLAQMQAAGSGIEQIYVDGEQIVTLMQEALPGVAQDAIISELEKELGLETGTIDNARQTGGSVAVDTGTWVNKVVGTPLYEAIGDHIKFSEAGLTLYQAKQEEARLTESFDKQINKIEEIAGVETARNAERQKVFDDVKTQLLANGRPQNMNKTMWNKYVKEAANLWAAHAVTESARQGISIQEWYEKNRVNIVRADFMPADIPETVLKKLSKGEREFVDNLAEAGLPLEAILRQAEQKRDEIFNQHYEYLEKNQAKGVIQGGLITDEDGNVINRYGRMSRNEKWYRDFYEKHGRKPNKSELRQIAQQQLMEGYEDDDYGPVPADVDYLSYLNTIEGVENLRKKLAEEMDENDVVSELPEEALAQIAKGPRGFVKLQKDQSNILAMLKDADASTFFHESAHLFLADMYDFIKSGKADEAYLKDWQTVAEWLGYDESQDNLTVEQQEKFARGFEAYLREGKSPSKALQKAFVAFRSWLIRVYKSARQLDVEINDGVRRVMDRMVATEAEIIERETEAGYFDNIINEQDLSQAQWLRLQELKEKAHEIAVQQLMSNEYKVVNEREEWLKLERKRLEEKLGAEIAERPIYKVIDKLHKQWNRRYDVKDLCKRYLDNQKDFTKEGKVKFEAFASFFGYPYAEDMCREIIDTPDYREVLQMEVDRELVQYADLDEISAADAEAALHNEPQLQRMALERAILQDLMNRDQERKYVRQQALERSRIAARVARTTAKEMLAGMPWQKATAATVYFTQERNAAVAQAGNLNAKDYEGAAKAGDKKVLNHALALEAMQNKKQVAKMLKYLDKWQLKKRPDLDPDHLNQIDKLLYRFELIDDLPQNVKQDRLTINDWNNRYSDDSNELDKGGASIPESMLDESFAKNYQELTLAQLQDLYHAIKNIETVGRNEKRLLTDEKRAEIEQVAAEMSEAIYDNLKVQYPKNFAPNQTKVDAVKHLVRGYFAAHKKVEFIVRALDGFKDQGVIWKRVMLPMMRAMDDELVKRQKMSEQVTEIIKKHYGDHPGELLSKKVSYQSILTKAIPGLTKENVLVMALNWGTETNRLRVVDGYDDIYTEIKAQKKKEKLFTDLFDVVLDENDWELVQDLWNYIGSFWDVIAADRKSRTGVAPEKVAALEVNTKYGVFEGGYFPIKYDPEKSEAASRFSEQEAAKDLFEASFDKPTTRKSYEQKRVAKVKARPLNLHLSVIDAHLSDVAHATAFTNVIRDVDRLLNQKTVRTAIEQTMGSEIYKQFRPWLMGIAREGRDVATVGPWAFVERILSRARVGATVVNMGLKFTTAITQVAGILPVAQKLGTKRTAAAVYDYYQKLLSGQSKEVNEFINGKSEMMRNRMQSYDRDIKDATRRLLTTNKMDKVKTSFFYLTGLMDLAVSQPAWLAGYNQHIEQQMAKIEAGKQTELNDEMAVRFADTVVRETQGSGDIINMAAIQRGTETQKLFTMFYSYFSVFANQGMEVVQRYMNEDPHAKEQAIAFAAFWWFFPAVVSELLAARGPDEDDGEGWLSWLASNLLTYPFQGFLVARDIVSGLGYGYQVTPASDAFETMTEFLKLMPDALKGEADLGKVSGKALDVMGYWLQIPSKQLKITVGNVLDTMINDQDFYLRDLFFAKPRSRK